MNFVQGDEAKGGCAMRMSNDAFLALICAVELAASVCLAQSDAEVEVVFRRGKAEETRTLKAVERKGGMSLVIPRSELDGVDFVGVVPEFARTKAGERGYFALSNGMVGDFAATNGVYRLGGLPMAFWGMKTPRRTFVCEVKGMELAYYVNVVAKDGAYKVATEFILQDERAYEDIVLDWTFLPDTAEYPDMAKVYRGHQLASGKVKPIRERLASQGDLAYIATSIEVRVRSSWKPAPSPVREQNEFNEPPLTVAMTFDRTREFVEACHKADIGPAEFCLVGWKFRGHDGRYPQIWPVEPQLGGEAALRRLVAAAQAMGYRIVVHNNHTDAYSVADCFDLADMRKRRDGRPVVTSKTDKYIWSGGATYKLCSQRAWERFVIKDLNKIAALGFRGLHYIDVMTIGRPGSCHDPRHPCTQKDMARYMGMTLAYARELMGGSASEGPYDFCAGDFDFCLYASYADPAGKKLPPLVTRMVPMWQLVYHGIILAMPFAACTNYTIKPNSARLAMVEYGGRPMFYLYSDYMTGIEWMGHEDLRAGSAAEMAESVAMIKKGGDEYARISDLQFELMEGHRLLAPGVALTVYANGAETVVNRSDAAFKYKGATVAPGDWRRF
jgi:hypothetical protein